MYAWSGPGLLAAQVLLIAAGAWLLQRTLRKLILKAGAVYDLPRHLTSSSMWLTRWIITIAAAMLIMGRIGVSGTVLWTAFTSFAAVAAVAFFAAWSVLSNIFCALLIFTARPLRVGDYVEILDTAEKPGAKGEVIAISLLYVTLQDSQPGQGGALLQIPNALIFQRIVRRWAGGPPPDDGASRGLTEL
ncbi:MAG: mechanosensitive ion channel family protein [Alcaligenaceae bacterium]|nr:mechanosensitive ion channel family protein [Parapusillimonas granuli]MEB2400435.1 mechanosensitive ion channel family protein [Alcaligenaceae bacterium]